MKSKLNLGIYRLHSNPNSSLADTSLIPQVLFLTEIQINGRFRAGRMKEEDCLIKEKLSALSYKGVSS